MKRLLILIAVTLCFQSCYRDKSEYYINQERDPDVVGVWMYENTDGNVSYSEYTADGRIYHGQTKNGVIDWNKNSTNPYWYTKNGYIYRYRYYGEWVKDHKDRYMYHLSEDKTQLFIGYQQPMTRTTLPE